METILQVISDPLNITNILIKLFDSGLTVGILFLVAYLLWKELKEERKKNDDLTDKIITNNIVMQEQLKDIIDLLRSERK